MLSKYWSNYKRCPTPLPFNIENKLAFLFVKNYAQILARTMSIDIINDDEYLKKIISDIKINLTIPKTDENNNCNKYVRYKNMNYNKELMPEKEKKLKKDKKEEIQKRIKLSQEQLNKIKKDIENLNILEIKKNTQKIFNIQEFEKDDDSNGHVDFIYAASNLKAEIYKIEKCDKLKVKLKAGKIIPAVSTTTAAIVGLVSLQFYTLFQTYDIKYLRDHYFNFAIKTFNFEYPTACKYIKNEKYNQLIPEKFNLWDLIEINEPMTINQFIQYIKKEYEINVCSIMINKKEIYSSHNFNNDGTDINRSIFINKKIDNIYFELFNKEVTFNKNYCFIKINGEINNSKIEMPLFKYNLKYDINNNFNNLI